MTRKLTAGALAAVTFLAACASRPTTPPELIAARDAVRAAETNAQVLDAAPLELKKATESLNRANRLSAEGDSLADVASAAYVAQRQAETAVAVASAKAKEDAIKSAEADRERARADAKAVEARRAQAQAADARLDASAAQIQAAAAQRQADAARAAAVQAQADAGRAQSESARLREQLDALQAQQTDRGMLVTLGDVLFEFGRAEIKPGAMDAIARLAAYLSEHPERQVLIEGYTDSVGSESANLLLSQRRAENVAVQLERLGVSPSRVSARGYGERFPIADNATDTNRALNRRVEIYISDDSRPVRSRG